MEAPVGEELKRRDDELAGPGPGRRAILVNTDRRSGVLDAAAIVLGNTDRPTDLQFVVGNRDDDDESKKAAKNGFSSSCSLSLLVPRLFIPKQMEFGFSLPI